jgi:transposase
MMGTTLDTEMKPGNRKGRPNYPVEFKRRLAAAACEAGVSVSKLAMANEVNANMVFKWRREFRAGLFDHAPQTTTLLPVVLSTPIVAAPLAVPIAPAAATAAPAIIDIIIADAIVRVHGVVDVALLRTVIESLRT